MLGDFSCTMLILGANERTCYGISHRERGRVHILFSGHKSSAVMVAFSAEPPEPTPLRFCRIPIVWVRFASGQQGVSQLHLLTFISEFLGGKQAGFGTMVRFQVGRQLILQSFLVLPPFMGIIIAGGVDERVRADEDIRKRRAA